MGNITFTIDLQLIAIAKIPVIPMNSTGRGVAKCYNLGAANLID